MKIYRQPNLSKQKYIKTKSKTVRWIILGVLAAILLVFGFLGYRFFSSLNKITSDSGKNSIFSMFDNKSSLKGQADGRTNILLLGNGGTNHPGGGLTDTIIVLSIDWKTKKTAMISVPRDLWVKVSGNGYAKINYAFFYGNQSPKITGGGGKVASDTVSEVLGIPIHYYVSLDFNGFKKTIDTLGGLDIYVDKALYDPFYPAPNMVDYDPFRIPVGNQHMTGDIALKYARSRETTSDFDRSRRQQQVLLAAKEKTLSLETLSNPKKITDLLMILGDHLKTNLSVGEIKSLWDEVGTIDTSNMINKVFDTAVGSPLVSTQDERGYIILPKKGIGNYTDLHLIAKNIFSNESQAQTQIKTSDLKIEILNGTTKAGVANQISQLLKGYGYNIVKIGNASTGTNASQTTVYNCSGTVSSLAAENLGNILKGQVKTKASCGSVDIQIIVGQNSL